MIGKEIQSICLTNNQKEENLTIQLNKIIRESHHEEDTTQNICRIRTQDRTNLKNASVNSATNSGTTAYSIAVNSQNLYQEETMQEVFLK